MSIPTTKNQIKLGRGARNQWDSFHQLYLDRRDQLREQYVLCRTHKEKRRLQELLIDFVKQMKGEFVEESPFNKKVLQVVTDYKKLLKKVSQALREERKGPQYKPKSIAIPPIADKIAKRTRLMASSCKRELDPSKFSKPHSPMNATSKKVVHEMREPQTISLITVKHVPSNELYPLVSASNNDWIKKEEDSSFVQLFCDIANHGLQQGLDYIDDTIGIAPDKVGSTMIDHQEVGDSLETAQTIHSVPENNELWDLPLDMHLSEDELWWHVKDLGNIFEF